MRDIVYNVFDIISYFVQGMLLVNLLKETQPRFPFKKYHSAAILLGQYVAVQIFLHYSVFIKSLLYGKSMVMNNSRQSILPVLISMLVTCVAGIFLFNESRLKIIYYVVTFYSVMELLKFAIYPLFLWLLTKLVDLNQYLFLDRQMYGETMFFEVNSGIEMFWNLSYVLVLLVFTYRIIVWMKKYLEMKENYENSQLIFVLFPSVTGLLLCLMIRSMMFSMEDNDIHSLFDSRPEMNLMVPCTSLLCIVMIIFTAKMLHKLIVESNQKIEISIYQERIREMEQHIGDIENLYAGIRGKMGDMARQKALSASGAGEHRYDGLARSALIHGRQNRPRTGAGSICLPYHAAQNIVRGHRRRANEQRQIQSGLFLGRGRLRRRRFL